MVIEQPVSSKQPILLEVWLNFDGAALSYLGAVSGPSAEAANKPVNAVLVEAGRLRLGFIGANPRKFEPGVLATLTFDVVEGPGSVTFNIPDTQVQGAAASAAATYGRGHPDEPLVLAAPPPGERVV